MTIAMPEEVREAFPVRASSMHKYDAGTVTVVGGSSRYIHAPVITGLGARAAGAGLVQLTVPDASRIAAAALVPEATFMKLTSTCTPPSADVTVVGMGLGTSNNAEATVSKLLSGSSGRFVLDADALTLLAKWYGGRDRGYQCGPAQTLVITPHAAEAARLLACDTAEILADRAGAAKELCEMYSAVTVLKGESSVVASPDSPTQWVCPAGNPFMALGGMGDLLAGMIGARWARLARLARRRDEDAGDERARAVAAVRAAVWLHAAAADRLVAKTPPTEPCVANVAASAASLRIECERG